jgi:hypothetical protein
MKLLLLFRELGKTALLLAVSGGLACEGSIADLGSQADAIVVGGIDTRTESSSNVRFDIAVDRVVKGDRNLQIIHVSHDWQRGGFGSDPSAQTISAKIYGIWFLTRTNALDWDVLPVSRDGFVFTLYLPAVQSLPVAYQYSSGASPTDALVYEMGATFESGASSSNETLLPIEFGGAAVEKVLRTFVRSSKPSLQARGLADMLRRNQDGALNVLQTLWPTIRGTAEAQLVISELRNSFRDLMPGSVQQLIEIANGSSSSSELRTAAIRAITAMHTRDSLSFAATLLDSSDPAERMRGVFALSSFANGCPPQTPETGDQFLQCKIPSAYRTKETMDEFAFRRGPEDQEGQLVSFWRTWWAENKSSLLTQ